MLDAAPPEGIRHDGRLRRRSASPPPRNARVNSRGGCLAMERVFCGTVKEGDCWSF